MERDVRLKETQDRIWRGSDSLLEKVSKVYNLFDERLLNAETNGLPREKYREIMLKRDLWIRQVISVEEELWGTKFRKVRRLKRKDYTQKNEFAPAADNERVIISVRGFAGESWWFSIKKTDKIEKVFQRYATEYDVDLRSLQFFLNGERIQGDATPKTLELESGDHIDCYRVDRVEVFPRSIERVLRRVL